MRFALCFLYGFFLISFFNLAEILSASAAVSSDVRSPTIPRRGPEGNVAVARQGIGVFGIYLRRDQ